jgi:hypothetical protein
VCSLCPCMSAVSRAYIAAALVLDEPHCVYASTTLQQTSVVELAVPNSSHVKSIQLL